MISIDSNKTISMTRGDTFVRTLTLSKNNTAYTPQEGDVVRFALANKYKDEYGYSLKLNKVIPFNGAEGTLTILPTETASLKYGTYVYDIQITYANGDVETFADKKQFILTEEVA